MEVKSTWHERYNDAREHDFGICVEDVESLSEGLFIDACQRAMGYGFTSGWAAFPTGASVWLLAMDDYRGDSLPKESKFYQAPKSKPGTSIQLRNYLGTLELLITDCAGGHWLYNKIDGLEASELIDEYWREVQLFIPKLGQEKESTFADSKEKIFDEAHDAIERGDIRNREAKVVS